MKKIILTIFALSSLGLSASSLANLYENVDQSILQPTPPIYPNQPVVMKVRGASEIMSSLCQRVISKAYDSALACRSMDKVECHELKLMPKEMARERFFKSIKKNSVTDLCSYDKSQADKSGLSKEKLAEAKHEYNSCLTTVPLLKQCIKSYPPSNSYTHRFIKEEY